MQSNILAKLKISKLDNNNTIKLLAATIALSTGLTAMDEAAAILDDELGVGKPVFKKSEGNGKTVKFLKGEENPDKKTKEKVNDFAEETAKDGATTKLGKRLNPINEAENEVGEVSTVLNQKEVKTGGDASSLPPEDKPKVEKEFELEKDPQQVEEKKKEIVDQLVEEENKEKIVVTEKESIAQGMGVEPSDDNPGVLDDKIRTLTGAEDEQVGPVVRGTKPNERGSAISESDKGCVAVSGAVPSVTSEVTQQPTAANVVFGWGVFLGQSAVGMISYLTPDFVKSAYGNVRDFFGNIADFFGRIRSKK